jgi:hypothetical protein
MIATSIDAWVNVVKDALTAVSVPITAYIAVRGLNTWHRQMMGTAEFELMRSVLRAVYKVRDSLKAMRSPFVWSGEGDEVADDAASTPLKQADKARIARWRRVMEAVSELAVVTNEAEVVWGGEARIKLLLLNKPYVKLGTALSDYQELQQYQLHSEQDRAELQALGKIIYQRGFDTDSDDFDSELNKAVKQIEDYVRSKSRP